MSKPKKNVGLSLKDMWDTTPNLTFSDDEAEETKAKVVDFDEDLEVPTGNKTGPSSSKLRQRNADLLGDIDYRYRGKKVSSKQIFQQSSDESSGEDDDDEDASIDENNGIDVSDDDVSNVDDNDDDDQSDSSSENIQEESNGQHDSSDNEEFEQDSQDEGSNENSDENEDSDELDESVDLTNPLRRDRNKEIVLVKPTDLLQEIYKGNCIKEQLNIWENILQMRILAQKVLNAGNKMPQYDVYPNFANIEEFKQRNEESKKKLSTLLDNLLSLQTELLNNYPETKKLLSGKRKANDQENENEDEDDEEIPSDFEAEDIENEDHNSTEHSEEESSEESEKKRGKQPPKKKMKFSDYEKVLAKNHSLLKEYREPIIQKLNDKTRVATGIISKDRKLSVVEKIDFAFSNRDKLLKKTQLKRSEYDIIGKPSASIEDNDGRRAEEYDTEIYDDYDFYHSLLRDFINNKLSDTTDPNQMTQKWIELDKMRSKMKRKIDTKATKGRRLRYNVHQKLVNWMAPIPDNLWTDNGKDELFNSLFKK